MSKESNTSRPGIGILAVVDVSSIHNIGQGIVFKYENALGNEVEGVVMQWKDRFIAFENRCPHWSLPLGEHDQFLDPTKSFIFCAVHGARFKDEDGECISGPCLGDKLVFLEIKSTADPYIVEIMSRPKKLLF